MDKEKLLILAKYRLDTAKEDLQSAIISFDNGLLRNAANRAYYCIFHSLRAVLALDEKDFKKHSAIIAYFNQHYINTKKFPEIFEMIKNASIVRNASDYDDFYIISKEKVAEQIESAKYILELVKKYIDSQ